MWQRMWRAARLEVSLYEEVEGDRGATGQALLVVVLSSLAAGIGGLFSGGAFSPVGLVLGALGALFTWALWAYMNYFIGARLLPEPTTQADWGQLLRTMGFAYSPGLLRVLTAIPLPALSFLVALAATVWTWMAMVVAVRQALDYRSTLRAVGVTALGFLLTLVLQALVFLLIRAVVA